MMENETINDFNSKLCDIANEAFAFGKKYSDIKLVRKTLRSLPERFAYKVAAIEEDCDLNTMSLKELMGSLQIFELNLKMNKKEKSIAFQAEKHESSDEGNVSDDESVVLLTQSFNRYLKMGKMNQVQKNKKTTNLVENKKSGK